MQVSFEDTENAWLGRVVLNRLPLGIAILDTVGSVLFANAQALALFGSADVVVNARGRRLCFVDSDVDKKFRRALGTIATRDTTAGNGNEVFVLRRPKGAQMLPLVVAVCGVETESGSPRLLLTFADAAEALSTNSVRLVAEFFGLTPAEQRLTQYLATGGRLSDAARDFGVSQHTVRNQLRAVFEKSGVQRQADLTRLVMTGAAANSSAVHCKRDNSERETSHAFH
ncbi:MAG TPA: PAS domain-containing protein [Rhizomicrobium sp.]